jgi:hypothetical protein
VGDDTPRWLAGNLAHLRGGALLGGDQEARTSFLKKRSKKLLLLPNAPVATRAQEFKSFLVLFFKKEHSCFFPF